jgi:hypothetical protein
VTLENPAIEIGLAQLRSTSRLVVTDLIQMPTGLISALPTIRL